LRNLNDFYGDEAYLGLGSPFMKYSAFHSFIEFIVDDVFYENASSIDLNKRKDNLERFSEIPSALADGRYDKLPIEVALDFHGIEHLSFKEYLEKRKKGFSECDEDDIYEFMAELRLTGEYERLVDQTVKEVFHVLFQNRELLLLFNDMIAKAIEFQSDYGVPEEFAELFNENGTLKRKPIPRWVQRAVFFRDRGRCVLCDKDLSGTINFENIENYDHIVPLARYGLNDVTNIQLLCKECNQVEKHAGMPSTSNMYQSWYKYDET